VAMPERLHGAVEHAARARVQPVAEYTRQALLDSLVRDGVPMEAEPWGN
jgi:hypothetical protein